MHNYEVKQYAKGKSVFHYEIAEELKISESAFSKLFRTEMDGNTQQVIIDAVDQIHARKVMNGKGAGCSICSHQVVWVSRNQEGGNEQ